MTLVKYAEGRGLGLDNLAYWQDYPDGEKLTLTFVAVAYSKHGSEPLTLTLRGDDRRAMLTYLQTHAVPLF